MLQTQNQNTDFQKSKTLSKAEDNLAQELAQIQNRMQEISANRESLEQRNKEKAERARMALLSAQLQDAANQMGGLQSAEEQKVLQQIEGERERQREKEQSLSEEERFLQESESKLGEKELALTQKEEEELGEFQALQRQQEMADPNSAYSEAARQELASFGIDVPENFSAAQIEENKDLMLKKQAAQEQRQFEEQKFARNLALEERKEARQLALEERRRKEDNDRRMNEMLTRQGLSIAKPQIAAFREATEAIENARDYKYNIDQITKAPNTPAGDMMLIDQLNKLSNKVEAEIDMKGQKADLMSRSLFGQIKGMNLNVLRGRVMGQGGQLTPEERGNLKNLADIFFSNIDNHVRTVKKGREFLKNIPLKGDMKKLLPEYLGSESLTDEDLERIEKEIKHEGKETTQFEEYKKDPDAPLVKNKRGSWKEFLKRTVPLSKEEREEQERNKKVGVGVKTKSGQRKSFQDFLKSRQKEE